MKLFRKIYKLTAWLIPFKKYRCLYKDFMTSLDLRDDIALAHKNYEKVLIDLKNKTDKIKVVFLIRENQKWTYQSLYEELEKSEKFEPLVLVSILELARKGKDKTRKNIEETYNFFKSRGMNVNYAYKNGEYVDLKEFKPDIVFYDQPWDLPDIHHPKYVSEFALTCYSSYGYEIVNYEGDYTQEFHRFLYKFYVEHKLNADRYESFVKGNSLNCEIVGYPKLDEYLKEKRECKIWKSTDKIKIIYAPHHSLDRKSIKLSTFKQNGKFMLDFAKKHPETTWVFKPHSRLKYALLRTKTMTEKEIEEYFNEWANIGAIHQEGDYFDLFRNSDIMITDSCSFLVEYLPTEKPLIRLINPKSVSLNPLGKKITEGYYLAYKNSDIENFYEEIITKGIDEKKQKRLEIINTIIDKNCTSCKKIYKSLIDTLENIK